MTTPIAPAAPPLPTRWPLLVTGGTRSGKSSVAETALAGLGPVTYLATGPVVDDADWTDRVRQHRQRRPSSWTTIESTDLPGTLATVDEPTLIDCLGTWLTAQLDALDAWERPEADWRPELDQRIAAAADAIAGFTHPLVVVTNEVGQSLVSMSRAGRLFTDHLGWLNQRVAAVSGRVQLVVAGCVLDVKG